MKFASFFRLTAALLVSTAAQADLVFKDDTGQEIRLKAPAKRIVTLAPHAAESLYAAGAGDRLVGTVDYSDYPPEAKRVPRVGGYSRIDLEAVAALKPDLVLAWESGNNMTQVGKLRALGLTVYVSQPNTIEHVADQVQRLGQLAGTVYAALGLGVLNKFLEGWVGAVLAKIAVLVFIIVFIQKRPQGIFAMKGRQV